jgi:hypothetical protein
MNCARPLDIVFRKYETVFELLARENQALLAWRDSLFVKDVGLGDAYGVRDPEVKANSSAGQCFDENLHVAGGLGQALGRALNYQDFLYWQICKPGRWDRKLLDFLGSAGRHLCGPG